MESLLDNIKFMQEFLKALFLVLHFSLHTLMTFFIISVILPGVIRHLISGNLNWLLNLNLIYKTLWTGARSGLLISVLEKLNWLHLTGVMTLILLMWKWMGLFLRKSHLLKVVCTNFLLVSLESLKKSTWETKENVFYFTLKVLSVLEIIKF